MQLTAGKLTVPDFVTFVTSLSKLLFILREVLVKRS